MYWGRSRVPSESPSCLTFSVKGPHRSEIVLMARKMAKNFAAKKVIIYIE